MALRPVLGVTQLVFYGVGMIVGAGIYSVIGAAAGAAGTSLWLSFVLSAGVALLTALSYAELASAFPVAGAEYHYLRRAFPMADWVAFHVGIILLVGGAATAATVAIAFGGYMKLFVDMPAGVSAVALLLFCFAFNVWGLRESSWLNILFTSIEVFGLLMVIAAGLTRDGFAAPLAMPPPQSGVLAAAAILFFVYLGFEEIANLAEEAHEPGRDMPRAIFLSLGIATVLYILVSLAAVALLAPAELAKSEAPLAAAIGVAWPRAGDILGAIALFATANTVLITMIATSRLTYSMARDREIPHLFARLLPQRETPWVAAGLVFVLAGVLVPLGSVKMLAELSSLSALLAFLAVNVALMALRFRMPDHPRPFRLPLTIGRLPLIPVLAIVGIGVLLANFESGVYLAGLAIMVPLAVASYLLRPGSRL